MHVLKLSCIKWVNLLISDFVGFPLNINLAHSGILICRILNRRYWLASNFRLFLYSTISSVQLSSVAQLCPTLCNPMDCSTPGFPVHHQLLELAQTHVHQVGDAIQRSHPLSSPSPPSFNLSQHQGLFQWVSSLHQVAKGLEFQLQHQPFQWIFRTDFLWDWLVGSPQRFSWCTLHIS